MIISSAAVTTVGRIRELNEDNLYFNGTCREQALKESDYYEQICDSSSNNCLFAVCDGMGGERYGEVASYIVAATLSHYHHSGDFAETINDYIEEANEKVCLEMHLRNVNRMGSTLALLNIIGHKAMICNLGDSRVYRFYNGDLEQLTEDHRSIIMGRKTGELTQHFGVKKEEYILEPFIVKDISIDRGMCFLLCSDGLTDMVNDSIIEALINDNKGCTPLQVATELIASAMEHGGRDNTTVIVVKIH